MTGRVSLREKLASFNEVWVPKIVGELNGQHVKVAKLEGEYVWHRHADEDEMFLVLDGSLDIHFRESVTRLEEGDFCIVPRGVEHKPVAAQRAAVLLFEPITTRNTGDQRTDLTLEPDQLERI